MSTDTALPIVALKAHLAINVRSVPESIEFYKKMFGIEPLKVRRGYAKFDVANPPLNFTLNEHAFGERGALSHLGIQVASTEDVHAVRDRWIEQGLVAREEEKTDCCFAIQDKAWVRDPDGNEWEVFVVLEDHLPERTTASASACCASGQPDKTTTCAV
jgi:catechol 2,3-dioxygenase-like lactoylglutathione lyase family enzyme